MKYPWKSVIKIIQARQIDIGMVTLSREFLSDLDSPINYVVLGKLAIPDDISLDDLKQKIRKITVYGIVKCSEEIRNYYNL